VAIGGNQPRRGAGEGAHRLVPLEEDDAAALVARCEVVAGGVELDGGYDVGCAGGGLRGQGSEREGRTFGDVLDLALVAETLRKTPAA
jgi:hypothetical protein